MKANTHPSVEEVSQVCEPHGIARLDYYPDACIVKTGENTAVIRYAEGQGAAIAYHRDGLLTECTSCERFIDALQKLFGRPMHVAYDEVLEIALQPGWTFTQRRYL